MADAAPPCRVLLDNCVPWRLGGSIVGHEVASTVKLGWADFDDGPLLDAMVGRFDVLVTVDKGIPHQQRVDLRPVAVVLLRSKSSSIRDLLLLVPELLVVIAAIGPGEVRIVGGP